MKKFICFLSITLAIACALSSCSKKDNSRDHEHTYGEWVYLDNPACTRAKYCDCGYRHVVSIPENEHVYGDNGLCVVCEKAVVASIRTEQVAIVNEHFNALKAYKQICDNQATLYATAWEFMNTEAGNYTTYNDLLTALSTSIGVDEAKLGSAITKIAQGNQSFVSPAKKFNTLKDTASVLKAIDNILVAEETSISSVNIKELANAVESLDDTYLKLIDTNLKANLKDYADILKSYSDICSNLKDVEYAKFVERYTKVANNATAAERTYQSLLDQYS